MKLLFYISTICNGGAARVMSNLANELSLRGHDCTLVTTFRSEEEYTLDVGVKRISFFDKRPVKGFLIKNYEIVKNLRSCILKERPDLLVAFLAEPCFRAAIATVGTNTKTVLSVRNDPNWEFRGPIRHFLAKYLFRRVDGIVFQTTEAQYWFPKSIQEKGKIIFNAVKKDFYKVELPQKQSGIVATGRLSRQKNHPLLIKSYAQIAKDVDDDLTIYGAGDSASLQDLAIKLGVGNRVHFPGQTMDVMNSIKSAKLYVMSSDFEGMPNALMEAMAMGLPCISTDCPCGGPRALFSKEMSHFLTPVGNISILADRMKELLMNKEARDLHGIRCQQAALLFSPDIIYKQWEDYLKEISNL